MIVNIVRQIFITASLSIALASSTAASAQTIKVGMLLPTSGGYAAMGNDIEAGFNIALSDAGMQERFEVISEDSEAKPSVGVQKVRKLILQDQADALVGIVSSAVLAAVRDFVDRSQVPLIVANAGNNDATGVDCSPYITRVSFSNAQITRPMGQWMYDQGIRTAYTMAPDYAAGQQLMGAFTETFVAAGGEIIGQVFTPFQNTQDFAPYLTAAAAENPDAVFSFYAGSEAINFVKQYSSLGIKADIPLYGSFITSPLWVDAQGADAEGVIASQNYIPTLDTPENNAFVATYREEYDRMPSEYVVQGYDAGRLLVEAVRAGATDKAAITAALSDIDYVGPRGPMTIDPKTNNVIQNIYIFDTISDANGEQTQQLLHTAENQQDPINGCAL